MEDQNSIFEFQKVISAKFTDDDLKFFKENSEQLFGDHNGPLNARIAIVHLADKALSRKTVIKDSADAARIEELTRQVENLQTEAQEFNAIKKEFSGYLIISKKYQQGNTFLEMFKAWLKTLHQVKTWIMTPQEIEYIKQQQNG